MHSMRKLLLIAVMVFLSAPLRAAGTLDVYFIDTEGGQSTLFVSPSGQTMLVDTGNLEPKGRDPARIAAVAKRAGVDHIDYLLITHYHSDHVGGVPELAKLLPITNFVDHGPEVEKDANAEALVRNYLGVRDKGHHILAQPGDRIPVTGIDVFVLTSAGREITSPLPGAGAPNPVCNSTPPHLADPSENAQSVGTLITFGKFRIIDLGDLTWNKEMELACPNNKIGTVDVYLSTHHGLSLSNCPALVHALRPRVAIVNNGETTGGQPEALRTIRSSPGIEDVWQLHYSKNVSKEENAPEPFIVNVDRDLPTSWIELVAQPDGQFTVTNSRNGKTKTYAPR
jgi:beta-lactamase superfamily II metal-dependent hydrolase